MFCGSRMGFVAGVAVCVVFGEMLGSACAGTIIQLGGSAASIGIQFDGGTLSTAGPQNTQADFIDFLDWYPDFPTQTASLSFEGVAPSGPADVFGGSLIVQKFAGGTLSLYDPAHTLLLSGDLSTSALTGTAGLSNNALFTTFVSMVSGGVLAVYIDRPTLIFQMHIGNINGGAGLSVGPIAPPSGSGLRPFAALATANIDGGQIPEPSTHALSMILFTLALASAHLCNGRNNLLGCR
jgi:hypothetical protein